MEETQVTNKKRFDFSSYAIVVGFLALEILAFISFYLGHSFVLYGSLSIALALLALLVTFRQINKDGITSFAFFLFPIFVYGLLTALSSFGINSVGAIGMAETVFVPIALTFISLSGFLTGYIKGFKIKTAMLIIYGALAIFVFINLLITMIYYVPFYTLIYSHSYIFYGGKPSRLPIGSMAYMLYGFSVLEVKLEYWTLFPSLLFTAVIPLFFLKYKDNKREFVLYAVYAGIAFLSLLFTISKITALSLFVLIAGIAIIVIVGKFRFTHQIFDGMMIAVGSILLLVFILLFVIAQNEWSFTAGIKNAFASNSLMSRLFITNRYASAIIVVFQDLVNPNYNFFKFFGVPVGGASYLYPNGVQQSMSNIWLVDNVLSSGLFGAIFFLAALVIGIRRLFKFIKNSEEDDYVKFMITGYVLGFLVISLLLLDTNPLVNSDQMAPMFTSAPLLIVLFLLSFVYNKTSIKPVKEEKEIKEVKEEEDENEVITL